jgi:hypothetical protein
MVGLANSAAVTCRNNSSGTYCRCAQISGPACAWRFHTTNGLRCNRHPLSSSPVLSTNTVKAWLGLSEKPVTDNPVSQDLAPAKGALSVFDPLLMRHCAIRAAMVAPPSRIHIVLAISAPAHGKTKPARSPEKKSSQMNTPGTITSEATKTSIHVIAGDKRRRRDATSASIPRPAIHQKTIPKKGQLRDRQNSGNIPRGTASLRSKPNREQGIFSTAGAEALISKSFSASISCGVLVSPVNLISRCTGSGPAIVVGQ